MMKLFRLGLLLLSVVLSELIYPPCAALQERYGTLNDTVILSYSNHPACNLTYTGTLGGSSGSRIERGVIEKGKPTKRYENRIKLGNDTIRLSRAVLNDRGFYELSCDDVDKLEVKLNVWEPKMVHVLEGTAKYDFYIDTNGVNSSTSQWVLKRIVNGFLHNLGTLPRTGDASSGMSVHLNVSDDGHVSVGFTNVRPSDLGTYALCYSKRSDYPTCTRERYPLLLHGLEDDKVLCETSTTSPGYVVAVVAVVAFVGALTLLAVVVLGVKYGWISEGRVLAVVRWIQSGSPPGPVDGPSPTEQRERLQTPTPESGPPGDEDKSSSVIPHY